MMQLFTVTIHTAPDGAEHFVPGVIAQDPDGAAERAIEIAGLLGRLDDIAAIDIMPECVSYPRLA
jgi:hypothetical protein